VLSDQPPQGLVADASGHEKATGEASSRFPKVEREKRLELLRILLEAVKIQLDYLGAEWAAAQLTAHGERDPAEIGTAHEPDISPRAPKGGEILGVSRGTVHEVASGPPKDARKGRPPP